MSHEINFFAGVLMAVAVMLLVCGAIFLCYFALATPDYRLIWRSIRGCRFGLKTAFGATAVVALAFGMLKMLGVEMDRLAVLCPLAITAPLALYAVAFVGLLLAELFDAKSTRNLIARKHRDDQWPELAERKMAAEDEEISR